MNSPSTEKEPRSSFSWQNLFLWVIIALLLRWQVVEPRWIPSGSMIPTLQIKDKILVEKIRPRFFRLKKIPLNYQSVVVFLPPEQLVDLGYESNKALIKRVVGLPGDHIKVESGNLYRNGEKIVENWRNAPMLYEMDEIIVPTDSFWVLGDNRNNSLDSHLWGPLPERNVIGTAVWRYWPLSRFGPIRFPTL